jgi:multicomponent Na+:H+ antiporter subunit B
MPSLIFRTAVRLLLPLMLLFSFFVLLRGHNEPGGGFVGGLIAAAAFTMYTIAFDLPHARAALFFRPITIIGSGLTLAIASAALPLLFNLPFFTGIWLEEPLPVLGKVGTALGFDTGVYLVVIGVVLTIVFAMSAQEEQEHEGGDY